MKTAEKAAPAPAREESRAAAREGAAHEAPNLALQELFHNGSILAKLTIGATDDPAENEADRMADAALAGRAAACHCAAGEPPCSTCRARAAMVRRKPRRRDAGGDAGNLDLGNSRTLSPSERAPFESSYRADLSSIRLHDNAAAAAGAERIGARAFSYGEHIAFAAGEYAPGTREGQRLLGHELAHAVQGGETLRREPNASSANAPASQLPAEGPSASSVTGAAATAPHPSGYDPCKVDVKSLNNYLLLAELNHVRPVVGQGRGASGYFDYRNLQRRVEAEIMRRAKLGHAWMAELPSAVPGSLYRLQDAGDGTINVLQVPGTAAAGEATETAASPLYSQAQFEALLKREQLATTDFETYRREMLEKQIAGGAAAFTGGFGLGNSPLDANLMDPYSRDILAANGSGREVMKWRGRFGEEAYQSKAGTGFGLFNEDLNARNWTNLGGRAFTPAQEAYPAFDFQRRPLPARVLGMARISVKTSLQATAAGRYSYYREGLAKMLDVTGDNSMRNYVANQPEYAGQPTTGPQYAQNRSRVLADSYLAINSEDVAGFRAMLADPTQMETPGVPLWNDNGRTPGQPPRPGWRQLYEGAMREHPVTVGMQTYDTPNALDAARASNAITQAQYVEAQQQVGRRVGNRLISAGAAGGQVENLRRSRLRVGNMPQSQLEPLLAPEYLKSQRYGGGMAGELRAVGDSSARGAGIGGLIAVVTTAGVMWIDEADHPEWGKELATTGGMAALGGGVGAGAEQALISAGTQRLVSSTASGTASRLTPGLVSGGGRFVGAGLGAGVVELASIGLLEDREHSGAEVGVRTSRAFVLGGTSAAIGVKVGAGAAILGTAMYTAGVGLAGGTVVPGVGNAVGAVVGFIVGLGAGALAYYAGDKIVPGGREDWDAAEAGCQPLPTVQRWKSAYDAPMFACFEASTRVTLADGSARAIADIAIGDVVLSYDEAANCLVHAAVTAVHEAPPDLMLAVELDDGTRLEATSMHKVYSSIGWRPLGDLRPGDALWCARPGRGATALAAIAVTSITRVLPRGPVYDLSIDGTHTYFAAGVLAHNKLP